MAGEFSTIHGDNFIRFAGASGAYIQVGDGTDAVQIFPFGITKNGTDISGSQGETGLQGTTGPEGGPVGPQGETGVPGPAGGLQGATGVAGIQGATGPAGPAGPAGGGGGGGSGAQGLTGFPGLTGADGVPGTQGAPGVDGVRGLTGSGGMTGAQGLTGVQGITGAQGINGATTSILSGSGLTGGGALSSSRTLSMDWAGITGYLNRDASNAIATAGGSPQSLTDTRDLQVYNTVNVAGMTWTTRNFAYNASGSLPGTGDQAVYGRFYTPSQLAGLAPTGWHVATTAEWLALMTAAGIPGWSSVSVNTRKLRKSTLWNAGAYVYNNGTDTLGIGLVPAGYYVNSSSYVWLGDGAYFLNGNGTDAFYHWNGYADALYSTTYNSEYYYTVRLVKDTYDPGLMPGLLKFTAIGSTVSVDTASYAPQGGSATFSSLGVTGALLGADGVTGAAGLALVKQSTGRQVWDRLTSAGITGMLPLAGGTLTGTLAGTTGVFTGGVLVSGGTVNSGTFFSLGTPSTRDTFVAKTTGDTYYRFYADGAGKMQWGDGTLGQDVAIERVVASELQVTGSVSPLAASPGNLGSDTKRWSNVFATNARIYGTLLDSTGATGASASVLTKQANGTQLWSAPSGGGGYTVTGISGAAGYTATQTSGTQVLEVNTGSTNTTVYLPTAAGNTAMFVVKKTASANTITLDGFNSEVIDGAATTTVTGLYESKTLVSNNANWLVI